MFIISNFYHKFFNCTSVYNYPNLIFLCTRFLIAAVTASCKCVSDVYSTNAFFAKVGGISTHELNAIELEFCKLLGWRLQCSASLLQQYYINLVNTNQNFKLPDSSKDYLPPMSPQSPIDPYLDHA